MNKPLDTSCAIFFGDDPDEIVTIVEQPRTFGSRLALAPAQRLAAAMASVAMTCLLLGGVLLAMTAMADGATTSGGTVVFAQAT